MARRRYKARIDWKDYAEQDIIFPVCPRSPGVRRGHFEATVKALSEHVRHVRLILCDFLDRYNLSSRTDDPEKESLRLGNQWLETGLPVLDRHIPDYEVYRWQDVLSDPSFKKRLSVMEALYNTNTDAEKAIHAMIGHYLNDKENRAFQKGLPFNAEEERGQSVSYMIEELAGTATYAAWFPGVPEAYWGVYAADTGLFNRLNTIDSSVCLKLPETCPVHLEGLSPQLGECYPLLDVA